MSYTPISRKRAVLSFGQGITQVLLTGRSFARCRAHCDTYARLYILPSGATLKSRYVDDRYSVYKATYRVPKNHPVFLTTDADIDLSATVSAYAEIELYIESAD